MNKIVKSNNRSPTEQTQDNKTLNVQRINSLAHHGVKGMKWGVRKDESHSGSKFRRDVIKGRGTMSDEQLRKAINRLQMEKRLKDLASEDLGVGRKAVGSFLGKVGTTLVTSTVNQVGTTIGSSLGKDLYTNKFYYDNVKSVLENKLGK